MSAGHADFERAVFTRWSDQWSETATAFGTGEYEPTLGQSWVRLTIVEGAGTPIAIGESSPTRYPGVVTAQIFVVRQRGEREMKRLADIADAIFKRAQLVITYSPGVKHVAKFRDAGMANLGPDGPWYQGNVTFPYTRDHG